jgi:hypothetical protein
MMRTSKQILNFIIKEKANGSVFQEMNTQMKIMMKGINVKGILEDAIPDSSDMVGKLERIATEFDVNLEKMS